MTRILLLTLLFMPTVLSTLFNKDLCGEEEEFTCLVRENCYKVKNPKNQLEILTRAGDANYKQPCDLHVMIKQYNVSSYFIRFITKASEIKLEEDKSTFFGCELKDKKISTINSESTEISYNFFLEKNSEGDMICEFVVTYKNGKEVFPNQDMQIVYNPTKDLETITLSKMKMDTMKQQFIGASYRCNPGSIHFGISKKFQEGGYFLLPLHPHSQDVQCPDNYEMVFENPEGDIQEAESIKCEKDQSDWKYSMTKKGKNGKENVPEGLTAACRRKTCRMCKDESFKCDGDKCIPPKFTKGVKEEECHTLKCEHADSNGESIVTIDGGKKKEIGKFECTENGDELKEQEWAFTKSGQSGKEGKAFTTATCYDTIECPALKCTEDDECPTVKSNNVTCAKGFEVEITDSSDETHNPKIVECDNKKGNYQYSMKEGDEFTIVDNKMKITCAKKDPAAAKSGMETWHMIAIVGVIILIILIIIFIFLCVRRSKKASEEKKSLLKKNDSQPSSVAESSKPQTGRPLVQMQQPSTAKQISSEQPSENTAKAKTDKEKAIPKTPKTTIAPTIDLETAHSTKKSKKERSTGSIETEVIHDGKKSQEREMDESAPSGKASQLDSQASKKEGKDDKLKPRKFELDEKEKKIAKGVWRRNEDYPTMADIESDWDDAKDGKPPSKQRTATKDIPTADTPSNRGAKGADLNEKTAEMERLLDQPEVPLKLKRGTSTNEEQKDGDDSYVSVRKEEKKFTKMMSTLDVTQDQQK